MSKVNKLNQKTKLYFLLEVSLHVFLGGWEMKIVEKLFQIVPKVALLNVQ